MAGDTLEFTFFSGTPNFKIATQSNASFTKDPSGLPVNLAGTAGARIMLIGFRGDFSNYAGPKTMTSSGPLVLQVAELGDFEGQVTWGVGLSQPGCAVVTKTGSSLMIQFVKVAAQ